MAEISVEAIREAIINAFCHRDYRNPGDVQVAVFKDRVEIRNPRRLFGGLTIEDIRNGNVSKRRNPLIANLLRHIHMVEAWGRGMPVILKNTPDVKFREVAEIFITSFKRSSFVEKMQSAGEAIDKKYDGSPKASGMILQASLKTNTKPTADDISATAADNAIIRAQRSAHS